MSHEQLIVHTLAGSAATGSPDRNLRFARELRLRFSSSNLNCSRSNRPVHRLTDAPRLGRLKPDSYRVSTGFLPRITAAGNGFTRSAPGKSRDSSLVSSVVCGSLQPDAGGILRHLIQNTLSAMDRPLNVFRHRRHRGFGTTKLENPESALNQRKLRYDRLTATSGSQGTTQ